MVFMRVLSASAANLLHFAVIVAMCRPFFCHGRTLYPCRRAGGNHSPIVAEWLPWVLSPYGKQETSVPLWLNVCNPILTLYLPREGPRPWRSCTGGKERGKIRVFRSALISKHLKTYWHGEFPTRRKNGLENAILGAGKSRFSTHNSTFFDS